MGPALYRRFRGDHSFTHRRRTLWLLLGLLTGWLYSEPDFFGIMRCLILLCISIVVSLFQSKSMAWEKEVQFMNR
eukprot:UN06733